MLLMIVAGAIAGMLIGLRFKVFALLPLLGCGILCIAVLASVGEMSWAATLGRIAAFAIGSQVGYVVSVMRTSEPKAAPRLMATH